MNSRVTLAAALLLGLSFQAAGAATWAFDAEGAPDLSLVQPVGPLSFENAQIFRSGLSLNEFEFPPRSGINVVVDDSSAIQVASTMAITEFSAYFTYLNPITISGFDDGGSLLGQVTSMYTNNTALSGDVGSVPNEFIKITFARTSAARLTIAGDPAGFSFAMDDLLVTAVPEVSSWLLLLLGLPVLVRRIGAGRHQ